MIAKIIMSILMGFMISLSFSPLLTPIIVLFRTLFIVPVKRKKLVKEAEDKGHYVDAKLAKAYDDRQHNDDGTYTFSNCEVGIYKYEYKNKTITYRGDFVDYPPQEIRLYYLKNPKKATDANSLGLREVPWLKIFLKTFLIVGVICSVLAYIGLILLKG